MSSQGGWIQTEVHPIKIKKTKRVFMWTFLAIQVLFIVWIVGGIASAGNSATDCGTLSAKTCEAAQGIGTSIGVALVVILWVVVDVILGIGRLIVLTARKKSA